MIVDDYFFVSCFMLRPKCSLWHRWYTLMLISSSSKVLDPMPAPLMSVEKAFLRSTSKKVWIVVCFTCGLTKLVQSLQKTTRPWRTATICHVGPVAPKHTKSWVSGRRLFGNSGKLPVRSTKGSSCIRYRMQQLLVLNRDADVWYPESFILFWV